MSAFRRTRAFYHRRRVKRLERAMLVAHEKLLAAEAAVRRIRYELEVAYDEAEDVADYMYIPCVQTTRLRVVREQGFDDSPECEKDNVVEFRPR